MAEVASLKELPRRAAATIRAHPVLVPGIVLLVLLGAFIRIWALGREPINSDEAVVGLMAREILHGHFSAFYWGQSYGGGEPYVVALLFLVFGQSGFTLTLTPVLLDAVSVLLVVFLGRRLFSLRVGVTAGLLFWLWPEVYIWQSTLEYGFRWVALICSLSVALLSLRLLSRDSSRPHLDWAALGLFAGIGWWSTPEIVYYVLPSALMLGYHVLRKRLRFGPVDAVVAVGALLLGALPWIWANVRSNFQSLRPGVEPDPRFLSHMKALVVHALPILLGLQLPVPAPNSVRWFDGANVGELLLVVVVAAGAFWLAVLLLSRRASWLVLFTVLFPFLYAASPFTWYWSDDRYAVFLAPIVALLVASSAEAVVQWLAERTARRALFFAPAVLVLCLGMSLTGWAMDNRAPWVPSRASGSVASTWTSWTSNPNEYVTRLSGQLLAAGQHDLYAGYWVSYVLDFSSGGAITASDARYARYLPYLQQVSSNPRSGWLFVDPRRRGYVAQLIGSSDFLDPGCAAGNDTCLDAREFKIYLADHKISSRTIAIGDFVVVLPAHPVDPDAVYRAFKIVSSVAG